MQGQDSLLEKIFGFELFILFLYLFFFLIYFSHFSFLIYFRRKQNDILDFPVYGENVDQISTSQNGSFKGSSKQIFSRLREVVDLNILTHLFCRLLRNSRGFSDFELKFYFWMTEVLNRVFRNLSVSVGINLAFWQLGQQVSSVIDLECCPISSNRRDLVSRRCARLARLQTHSAFSFGECSVIFPSRESFFLEWYEQKRM